MLPIVRLAHHRDPEAIAEIVRHQLQCLNTENLEEGIGISDLEVKVTIDDSSLDLQIHTNSVLDKEKILTLIRYELQNLHIESVAKVRVQCWRNDEEFDQTTTEELNAPTPLWTEQFMIEPSQLSKYQNLDLDLSEWRSPEAKIPEAKLPETRAAEPQLSKHSVLQQAIAQIAATSDHAKKHLVTNDLPPIEELAVSQNLINRIDKDINTPISALKMASEEQHQAAINENYWQLLLVGGSIVLLGLGIGAIVRAVTLKNLTDKAPVSASDSSVLTDPINSKNNSKNNSLNNSTNTNDPTSTNDPTKQPTQTSTQTPNPSDPLAIASSPSSSSVKPNPYTGVETATPTPNSSELTTSASPLTSSANQTITLEKFNLIQKGMTIEQVEKIFGISGKIIAETNSLDTVGRVYSWKNPEGSNAIIEFKDGQVVAKAQAGL
ncbi:MAG: hypothetical protein WCP16_08375 [Pseudanabaena sp. ELA645]|jgi:hypothetical protein